MSKTYAFLNDYANYFDIELPIPKHGVRKNIADMCMIAFVEKFCAQYLKSNYDCYFYIARALLITTLKNDNDLLNIFDPEKYFALKPSELIYVENNVIQPLYKFENELSETRRKYFQKLLLNCKIPFDMYDVPNLNGKGIIYYIPYSNALSFVLNYVYQNIKAKEDKVYKAISKKKKVDLANVFTGSQETIKSILKTTLNIFNLDKKSIFIEDRIFEIYQLKKIDDDYKFFKINKMVQRMEEIKVKSTFERMYERFDLKYNEVTRLEELFNKEIFYNDGFIEYCLKTSFHDPLYVFQVVLESMSKNYFEVMDDPERRRMLNKCWEKNYLKANFEYDFLRHEFSFKDFLVFCRILTIQKIDDLLRKVNRVVKYQNREWNNIFKEFPKDINDMDMNFHREIISNFASHIEDMKIEDFDWLLIFDSCDEGREYHYVHASKYWDEYYFSNRERLEKYISSTEVDEVPYMNFLFNKAINLMPKYEKYAK